MRSWKVHWSFWCFGYSDPRSLRLCASAWCQLSDHLPNQSPVCSAPQLLLDAALLRPGWVCNCGGPCHRHSACVSSCALSMCMQIATSLLVKDNVLLDSLVANIQDVISLEPQTDMLWAPLVLSEYYTMRCQSDALKRPRFLPRFQFLHTC